MFERITPEAAGISSDKIVKFIDRIEKRGAIMHSILMMRHGKIFNESYWAPFNKDFCHRMYSQTKSYAAIAIGLLEEEGKLSLDDKVCDIFPDKIDGEISIHLKEQTVRQMLTMTTVGNPVNWFYDTNNPDRTHIYFNERTSVHPAGTIWEYDSAGSQVLCAIVERLSGMPMLDYLKSKLFNKMGTFKTANILKTRNNDSWGDSALLCTTRDMASCAQLLMDGGVWEGERLINEKFVKDATSKQVDNSSKWFNACFIHGYGYQIWRTEQNGFAFVGMGDEITIALPDRGLVFVCTADHQGTDNLIRNIMVNAFFDIIVDNLSDEPLPEDKDALERLTKRTLDLKLRSMQGMEDSPFRKELNGRVYECEENPMGITKFHFTFSDDGKTGELHYTNAQGDKVLPFGVNHNVFGKFPQLGYSNDHGGLRTTDGFMYNDAVSFAWLEDKKLIVFAQIIDRYFGLMSGVFAFRDNYAAAQFRKVGEDFLQEYNGDMWATAK
ncbi:MAG: serine hydrolase [Clostridia bacterium]|nr:serine hydrolase [Clostridia bacterium]